MFIVVEGSAARRELFRSLLLVPFVPSGRSRPQVLGNLDDALVRARSIAPHDVIGLQQLGLRGGRSPVQGMA